MLGANLEDDVMDYAAKEAEPESWCNGFEPANPTLKQISIAP